VKYAAKWLYHPDHLMHPLKRAGRRGEGKWGKAEASWWFPEQPGGEPDLHGVWESNANVLTANDEEFMDPLTGDWANRALLCRVYRV
jgi:hypothetical protein